MVGNIRVEILSDSLVRLEAVGPEGFEDRPTFHIVERAWKGAPYRSVSASGEVVIKTANYRVHVPQGATSLAGSYITDASGQMLYRFDGSLSNSVWLPGPSDNPRVWSFADTPRIVPPQWGLIPAPRNEPPSGTSGWDLGNDAPDVYVFVPHGDYRQLRKDFIKLTGPTEMPPLYVFGAFDSRWYDYNESTALKQIADYRARRIPLDVLVIDTGWRMGASIGYQPNTNLFPNLGRFITEAHEKNVRLMFNDHPEPKSPNPLSATELDYRYAGLAGLLREGLDIWWFDRNWTVALKTPMPNLRKEVWGMRLYHDITQSVRPTGRPVIMANVDGIDNGIRRHAMDVAAHRFSIQWTGDIRPGYDYLRRGVENAVHAGVQSLFSYMSEDLGGHVADPSPEGYIRWIEYGALSPVYRPHCTHNHERMPWVFGPEAEEVARRFLNLRYRLLPLFYAAAHENYETGEPLLRRLDLDYPEFAEARSEDQYLLGKGILVAPVMTGSTNAGASRADTTNTIETLRSVWLPPGTWIDAWTGQTFAGPTNVVNRTPLGQVPLFIKSGTVVALAPEMEFTGEKPWDPMMLDIYPGAETGRANVYEDDTQTVNYKKGDLRNTLITAKTDDAAKLLRVRIGPARGKFKGGPKARVWTLRIHTPTNWPGAVPGTVTVNGRNFDQLVRKVPRVATAMPLGDPAGAPDGDVFEVTLPETPVSKAVNVEVRF